MSRGNHKVTTTFSFQIGKCVNGLPKASKVKISTTFSYTTPLPSPPKRQSEQSANPPDGSMQEPGDTKLTLKTKHQPS